jgi:hypothetical protein
MRKLICVALAVSAAALCGCTTMSGDVGILQKENTALQRELREKNDQLERIGTREREMIEEAVALKNQVDLLEREKQVRIDDLNKLKYGTRSFLSDQMLSLRKFYEQEGLLDFVGSEIIERAHEEGENLLLVDLKNTLSGPGTLVAGWAYLSAPGSSVMFCLLRPVEKDLVVVWQSEMFTVGEAGAAHFQFAVPPKVNGDEIVAVYCAGVVKVPFDLGTGDVRSIRGPVKEGDKLKRGDLQGKEGRAYSFCVVGLLQPGQE